MVLWARCGCSNNREREYGSFASGWARSPSTRAAELEIVKEAMAHIQFVKQECDINIHSLGWNINALELFSAAPRHSPLPRPRVCNREIRPWDCRRQSLCLEIRCLVVVPPTASYPRQAVSASSSAAVPRPSDATLIAQAMGANGTATNRMPSGVLSNAAPQTLHHDRPCSLHRRALLPLGLGLPRPKIQIRRTLAR